MNSHRKTVVSEFTVSIPIIQVMPSKGSNTIIPFTADLLEVYIYAPISYNHNTSLVLFALDFAQLHLPFFHE